MEGLEQVKSHLMILTIFDANNTSMTVEECAKFNRCCKQTVLSEIHKGNIIANKMGRLWSIPKMQFMDRIIEDQSK